MVPFAKGEWSLLGSDRAKGASTEKAVVACFQPQWPVLKVQWPNFILCIIFSVMTETDAQRFRKDAQECREQAEKAISQLDKEAWLRLAADWIKLAQAAEERHRF